MTCVIPGYRVEKLLFNGARLKRVLRRLVVRKPKRVLRAEA